MSVLSKLYIYSIFSLLLGGIYMIQVQRTYPHANLILMTNLFCPVFSLGTIIGMLERETTFGELALTVRG